MELVRNSRPAPKSPTGSPFSWGLRSGLLNFSLDPCLGILGL